MTQNYLLTKAENYLLQSNYKRCLESCICAICLDQVNSELIINLENIFRNLTSIKLQKDSFTNSLLDLFEDFLNLIEGIDSHNLFSPLFKLYYAVFLKNSNLETYEAINKIIINALLKTDNKFYQVYAERIFGIDLDSTYL